MDRLKNDSVVLGTAADNMFYFVHVNNTHIATWIMTDIISKGYRFAFIEISTQGTHIPLFTFHPIHLACCQVNAVVARDFSHTD